MAHATYTRAGKAPVEAARRSEGRAPGLAICAARRMPEPCELDHLRLLGRTMTRSRKRASRRGYAMLLVVIFLVLLLSLLGATYRQLGSVVQVEAARSTAILGDQGCMQAAAQALAGLEANGPPSLSTTVSTFAITLSTGQTRHYQVTYIQNPTVTTEWTVSVQPAPGSP
jgi:hypothetical protein